MGNLLVTSTRVRQFKVLGECIVLYQFIKRVDATRLSSHLHAFNQRLSAYQPWQLVLGTLAVNHFFSHATLLLGLGAPHNSLYMEPDCHYSPSFSRVRWLLTALDAGVLSSLKVRIPFVRHVVSLLLGLWYLVYTRRAENKINAFRKQQTIEALRATWEKGRHPLITLFNRSGWPALRMACEPVEVAGVPCAVFYHGSPAQLRQERHLILDFPGGGFCAMSPVDHGDYLSRFAKETGVPVLAVNYRKAPEHPYPAGFNDCWAVYEAVVKGHATEVLDAVPDRLALVGDSAGGNFAAGITLRALLSDLRAADGVHLIYPVLDLSARVWTAKRSQGEAPMLSSRAKFSNDGVLPLTYLLKIGEVYLSQGGDPEKDVFLSPLRAPEELLERFPQTFIHVGSVDPLVDDSMMFVDKLCATGGHPQLRLFEGCSHAYMNVVTLLPEAEEACKQSVEWLREITEKRLAKL